MSILVTYRAPFDFVPHSKALPDGLSLMELAREMETLPEDFLDDGIICINGAIVHRQFWPVVRPKPSLNGAPIEVTFHASIMGGGEGKNPLAIILGIAITVATGFIAGGGLAAKFGLSATLFGAGSTGSLILAAGISYLGSLAIASLSPPPVSSRQKRITNPGAASVEGNVLEPNGAVPRVIGQRKIYPPLLCQPFTYYEGADEIVEAVFGLAGPHQLTDIKIGNAPISNALVTYETREGWPGDPRITLIDRQAYTEDVQSEMKSHSVQDDGYSLDIGTGTLAEALPVPFTSTSGESPDEIWLQIAFPQGLHRNASETDYMRVPLRVRMRLKGDVTWINLPEVHYQAANLRQLRATLKIKWYAAGLATVSPSVANNEGFVEARISTPAQTLAPAAPGFDADAYFVDGGGVQSYLNATNLATSKVAHTYLTRHNAFFAIDESVFPRGAYEFEIVRGGAIRKTDYVSAGYSTDGNVLDLFGYYGTSARAPYTRDGVSDACYMVRACSIWNEHPVPTDEFAIIAIRSKNKALDKVSTVAGGWVRDWDGAGWNTWAVTGNPAPHLRDIYSGYLNKRPVPYDILDDDEILTWRTACNTEGYTCNHVSEDESVLDAAQIVSSCGFAQPYMSEVWGVVRDFDRSAETPVQVFSPRNSRGFTWSKGFPIVPDGLRVNYRSALYDYDERQLTVPNPDYVGVPVVVDQANYEGLGTVADVTRRANYDQLQAKYRNIFYTIDVPIESIVCRRGSLVGFQHESLSDNTMSARVTQLITSGGNVTGLVLDADLPLLNESDMHAVADMHSVLDMHNIGVTSAVRVRLTTGLTGALLLSGASSVTNTITFTTPQPVAGYHIGALVLIGPVANEMERFLVYSIEPKENLTATLTLVDEAPELFA